MKCKSTVWVIRTMPNHKLASSSTHSSIQTKHPFGVNDSFETDSHFFSNYSKNRRPIALSTSHLHGTHTLSRRPPISWELCGTTAQCPRGTKLPLQLPKQTAKKKKGWLTAHPKFLLPSISHSHHRFRCRLISNQDSPISIFCITQFAHASHIHMFTLSIDLISAHVQLQAKDAKSDTKA